MEMRERTLCVRRKDTEKKVLNCKQNVYYANQQPVIPSMHSFEIDKAKVNIDTNELNSQVMADINTVITMY